MGSLNKQVIDSIFEAYNISLKDFPVFIETGTHTGKTCISLGKYFRKVYTIEISKKYFEISKKNLSNFSNIDIRLGDSSKILPDILKTCNDNVVFWLDGHFSNGDTGKGEKDCPVLEECQAINEFLLRTKSKSIILIDDCRLFGTDKEHSWSDITKNNILSNFSVKILDEKIDFSKDMYQIFASGE